MANKIKSIELQNGVVVTFTNRGTIELSSSENSTIALTTSDLESIRDVAKSNGKIEAGGNGVITNSQKEKV